MYSLTFSSRNPKSRNKSCKHQKQKRNRIFSNHYLPPNDKNRPGYAFTIVKPDLPSFMFLNKPHIEENEYEML